MKKKLLFIINTMGRAGAEMALIELLKKLDSMGVYELSLYTVIPCGELFDRVPEHIQILNKHYNKGSVLSIRGHLCILKSVIFSFFYKLTGFRLLGYMIRNIKEQRALGRKLQYDKLLWRLLADGHPDIEGSYDLAVAYIEGAAAYCLADKVKAHHKAAFIHIDYKEAGYTPLMDQNCYEGVEKIFAVSKEVGQKFCSVYPKYKDKVELFRNLLDKNAIRKKAEEGIGFTDEFDGIRVVTVGRLHYQKGYDIAIEALAKLRDDGYPVRWYVIGEGIERRNLETLIKKYRVEEYFILMGAKDNPYPFMKQADIYVHATRFEGKSIAIEEAQILGKTIVASDCTGNTEQIKSGYDGVLLTLNVENLVRELERLIDEPGLQKEYAKHVLEKKLEYPKDLESMLALLKEEKEGSYE
jgi:glycosyltransferase involved in cell wall biosynthesis